MIIGEKSSHTRSEDDHLLWVGASAPASQLPHNKTFSGRLKPALGKLEIGNPFVCLKGDCDLFLP